ncbi:MAG: DUF1592 domain-containing protein [Myxococcales bacterium]|nr:DUF1592 domain-containing protein [Myxococcales bacterium]MCB9712813.1 DUF1592 domain-containing protein [Myxococcales bacterium]
MKGDQIIKGNQVRRRRGALSLGITLLATSGCYSGRGGFDPDLEGDGPARVPGADDGGPVEDPPPADFEPAPASMRRLTQAEYARSVADAFSLPLPIELDLEADETTEEFLSIGASIVGTSEHGVEQYRGAAFDVASLVWARKADYPELVECAPTGADDPCVRQALASFGERLWRRPLSDDELERYAALVDAPYEEGQDPALGLQYALAALVESPNFIYLPFVGQDDPDSGLRRLSDLELASRLSYFLWGSIPDAELLAAAKAERLHTGEQLAAQAERMMEDPRAADLASRFFAESWGVHWLELEDKNPAVFEAWDPALLGELRAEFDAVLADLMERDADVRELYSGRRTLVSPALAEFYGLPAPDAFGEVALDERRWGLLTSGAVLAANSPSDRSSPTHRGKFLLEKVLCGNVPPPPDDVDSTLPDDPGEQPTQTTREKLEEHVTNPACAACHSLIDPLGFTFEHYDGIGAFRETENGLPIDPTGTYEGVALGGVADVARFLAEDERSTRCITKRLLSFAIGRETRPEDRPALEELHAAFADDDFVLRMLVIELVASPTFRFVADEEDSP